jgi:ribose 5-phosphate isomerase A
MSETEKDSQIRLTSELGKPAEPAEPGGQAGRSSAASAVQRGREAVGAVAATLVESGMVVGLGTGDTAAYFIRALGERVKGGLGGLRCVATSQRSAALALTLGLRVIDLDDLELPVLPGQSQPIDITIDGADEIDPALQLIKGAGGALLFEKLVARASRQLVIVADPAKLVKRLGEKRLLPVEVVRFGARHTLARLRLISGLLSAALRTTAAGQGPETPQSLLTTDGGNYIVDFELAPAAALDLHALHAQMKALPGVIETGLFLSEATRALIGEASGHVEILQGPASQS